MTTRRLLGLATAVITTVALTAGTADATDEANLGANQLFITTNPTAKLNANGSATVTGTYGCASTDGPNGIIEVTAFQDQSGKPVAGIATLTITCPATDKAWTATVTPTTGAFTSTLPLQLGPAADVSVNADGTSADVSVSA